MVEVSLRVATHDRGAVRASSVAMVEILVVREDNFLVLSNTKIHLQGIYAKLHRIEHGRKGLFGIQAHAPTVRLNVNDILRCLSHRFHLLRLSGCAIAQRRLDRIMVGDKRNSGIFLTDGLELVATFEP